MQDSAWSVYSTRESDRFLAIRGFGGQRSGTRENLICLAIIALIAAVIGFILFCHYTAVHYTMPPTGRKSLRLTDAWVGAPPRASEAPVAGRLSSFT